MHAPPKARAARSEEYSPAAPAGLDTFIEEKKCITVKMFGSISGSIDPFGRRNISSDTWLPERRAGYNAKRRQKDLELISSIWNEALPNANDAVVHIADAPAITVKKHKRAVNAHCEALVDMLC
eukprot:scaffold4540_cov67-Skeletonema_dohrnii-CCMP3373.AAC.2